MLAVHSVERHHGVDHQGKELVLAESARFIEVVKAENQLSLFFKSAVSEESHGTHELVGVDGAITVHVEHLDDHLTLPLRAVEELSQTSAVKFEVSSTGFKFFV